MKTEPAAAAGPTRNAVGEHWEQSGNQNRTGAAFIASSPYSHLSLMSRSCSRRKLGGRWEFCSGIRLTWVFAPEFWKEAYRAQFGSDPDEDIAALPDEVEAWRASWQGGYDAREEWATSLVSDATGEAEEGNGEGEVV